MIMNLNLTTHQMQVMQNGMWQWISNLEKELEQIDEKDWTDEHKANHRMKTNSIIDDCNKILGLIKPMCDIGFEKGEITVTGFKSIPTDYG